MGSLSGVGEGALVVPDGVRARSGGRRAMNLGFFPASHDLHLRFKHGSCDIGIVR